MVNQPSAAFIPENDDQPQSKNKISTRKEAIEGSEEVISEGGGGSTRGPESRAESTEDKIPRYVTPIKADARRCEPEPCGGQSAAGQLSERHGASEAGDFPPEQRRGSQRERRLEENTAGPTQEPQTH